VQQVNGFGLGNARQHHGAVHYKGEHPGGHHTPDTARNGGGGLPAEAVDDEQRNQNGVRAYDDGRNIDITPRQNRGDEDQKHHPGGQPQRKQGVKALSAPKNKNHCHKHRAQNNDLVYAYIVDEIPAVCGMA
jgi:hypothetical protein